MHMHIREAGKNVQFRKIGKYGGNIKIAVMHLAVFIYLHLFQQRSRPFLNKKVLPG